MVGLGFVIKTGMVNSTHQALPLFCSFHSTLESLCASVQQSHVNLRRWELAGTPLDTGQMPLRSKWIDKLFMPYCSSLRRGLQTHLTGQQPRCSECSPPKWCLWTCMVSVVRKNPHPAVTTLMGSCASFRTCLWVSCLTVWILFMYLWGPLKRV